MTTEEIERAIAAFVKRQEEIPFEQRYYGLTITPEYNAWIYNTFYRQENEPLVESLERL